MVKNGTIEAALWGVLFAVMLSFIVVPFAQRMVPVGWWFELHSLVVSDVEKGQCPTIDAIRTIHQPVTGSWIVEIRKVDEATGDWEPFASGSGTNDYTPDDRLPRVITLEWWTGKNVCPLPPGEYYIVTTWTFTPTLLRPPPLRHHSGTFRVFERPLT